MDQQPTCGQGLAEHAVIPAKLGELIAAIAENLEVHQNALDLTDEDARKEHEAYVKLAREHRSIATQLQQTANHMAAYRDLAMGRHDEQAMADAKVIEAFAKFVRREEELLTLLQTGVERDLMMLVEMRGSGE